MCLLTVIVYMCVCVCVCVCVRACVMIHVPASHNSPHNPLQSRTRTHMHNSFFYPPCLLLARSLARSLSLSLCLSLSLQR